MIGGGAWGSMGVFYGADSHRLEAFDCVIAAWYYTC